VLNLIPIKIFSLSRSMLSVAKFLRVFIAWWFVWFVLQAILLYWFDFSLRLSVTDSLITNTVTAAMCLLVSYVMQFYLPQKERYWYIFALSFLLSMLLVLISRVILTAINPGNAVYISMVKKTMPIRFGIGFLLIVCMSMISLSWYNFLDQKENEQRQADTEKLNKEAELFKLRQQLQPHFLFNSLNSISALVGTRPEEARRMIQQLSDFLRGTIKKEEQQFVTLAEELQHLQLYLDIEKVRFGHRLATNIESDETANQLKLPSLLLQPIVENAIKFGLYDTIETVVISIHAIKENNQLIITVQNPFDTQTAAMQKGSGFGLSSVKRRLHLLFARKDLLETTVNENIFSTTLKIPQV
jgi:two-component system LytT family sensor kinase